MKVPEPRKLPSGNWFIQLRLGGKSYSVTERSKKECIHQAELLKAQHQTGHIRKSKAEDLTLREAIEKYIADKYNSLSPSTRRGYQTIKKNRFQSVMDKQLRDIDNWQKVINAEATLCSAKTLANAWGLISSVLRYCKEDIPDVSLPKIPVPDLEWLNFEQVLVFVEAVKGKSCEIPALLALHSLRRSEILDLKWEDIDLDNKMIHVSGAAVYDENQKLVHKSINKTTSSKRDIPIMIPALSDAIHSCQRSGEYILSGNANTPWRQINKVCTDAGLPTVGVHGLRRSFASLAYHLGWPERITMAVGGWSDPKVMHKIYIKLAEKDKMAATKSMEDFFKNANEIANE